MILNIYFSKFQSLKRPGLLFWGGAYFEQTNRIFKIQKGEIRIIVGINKNHYAGRSLKN